LESLSQAWVWFAALSFRLKVLGFATLVVLVELGFRWLFPKSAAYRAWTRFFEGIVGHVWTAVLLGLVYYLSISLVHAGMRLAGRDVLDSRLSPEPSFWRSHEPNPLGPRAAARHQF
jgi:hypothetical protein